MDRVEDIFTVKNARPIWKNLRGSDVPIVSNEDYGRIDQHMEKLVFDLSTNKYMPSIGHGYLGYFKSNGCTRFVPILTKEDMTVYYLLVLHIQDYLIKPKKGVFGAWRSVPKTVRELYDGQTEEDSDKNDEPSLIDPYFANSFSKAEWFKNWTSFNEMIDDATKRTDIGNYVITTDIANFYDTIDVLKLMERINAALNNQIELVEYLRTFLGYWDRRVKGYGFSSKGIPQEIISDASRTLANFYLASFDDRMLVHCASEGQVYLRWADDIVIFGRSRKSLENTIHRASRFLLHDGLNLNAAKIKIYSRRDYRNYRGIDLLAAIRTGSMRDVERWLRKFVAYSGLKDARTDTIYRAIVGHSARHRASITPYILNYVEEMSREYPNIGTLSDQQLFNRVLISPNPKEAVSKVCDQITAYPYAAGRAAFLKMIRKKRSQLRSLGLSDRKISSLVNRISKNSGGSELIETICAPRATI